jgi:hypothetical protein
MDIEIRVLDLYRLALLYYKNAQAELQRFKKEKEIFVCSTFISNLETLHEHFMWPLALLGLHLEWWFFSIVELSLAISSNIYMSVTVSVSRLQ